MNYKIFASTVENGVTTQVEELSKIYEDSKIRIMPDCHRGAGCVIGTTMVIHDKITPNLVGVDIGCGMLTMKINNKELNLKNIDNCISRYIPTGFDVHNKQQTDFDFSNLLCKEKNVITNKSLLSIGTLGGGNHFIEISKDSKNDLYLIIHSGSRNLGYKVAKYYQELAYKKYISKNGLDVSSMIMKLKKQNRENEIEEKLKELKNVNIKTDIPKDLIYLVDEDFKNYIHDMKIVQKYAIKNRLTMANIILDKCNLSKDYSFETIHNYIDTDNMILRKGAVSAQKDEILLIPINMKDGSLLCKGKGNADWNYSAPHGAGRLMSRTKAKANINIYDFKKSMVNVYSSSINEFTLDEAPNAYKSMEEIINNIQDTVKIIDVLKPIYNFKNSK